MKHILLLALFGMISMRGGWSQGFPDEAEFSDPSTSLWLGSYLNARITDKFFWAGELHVRTDQSDQTPFVGRMGQIYNRHGVKYLFSKNFSATVGGVLRLNFTPDPGNPNFKPVVLEPRIWHEYLFAMPLERIMVYHRLRIEHRWSKSNREGAEFIYRDRWRYKFFMKIPLNRPKLVPGAFYFQPDVELIMQSGKPVVGSPLEDLRIYPMIGYIFNPRVGASAGVTYSLGQNLDLGYEYRQRWLLRFNCYISLDFRKFEERIPTSKLTD